MEPTEALMLLDKAVATCQTSREVHVKLQEAITVLRLAMVKKKEEPPSDKTKGGK